MLVHSNRWGSAGNDKVSNQRQQYIHTFASYGTKGLTRIGGIASLIWACAGFACARPIEVGDTAGLTAALAASSPGETVALQPGEYAPIIHDFHGSVTLTSADPTRPAVLTSLKVTHSSGITMRGLTLDNEAYPAESFGAGGTHAFQILGSSQISLSMLDVHGSPTGSLNTDQAGVLVRESDHVTIEGSNFHNLHSGVAFLNSSYVTIKNNDFHDLRDDGIDSGGSSNVLIEGNHCHSNHPDGVLDKDHPDCIQFWTVNTKVGAHDIVIMGNHYERERGHATQFIFMGNENHLRYDHVVIKDNVSIGSQWNAIRLAYAHDVSIVNNQVRSLCAPESGKVLVAWIAPQDVDGLVLKDNVAGSYPKLGVNTGVSESNNSTKGCSK